MKCYILGAGVSKSVGYPLGSELFGEIDKFVRESGPCFDRFDYQKDWNRLHKWLEDSSNPAISQAYRTRNIEQIFTALDFASYLWDEAFVGAVRSDLSSRERTGGSGLFENYDKAVEDYREFRRILLWALEHYFADHHQRDLTASGGPEWDAIKRFGETLDSDDVVITFNYDATLERILLQEGKWSPGDGFGFALKFQQSRHDSNLVKHWTTSEVKVLHLHGATGWYRRPTFAPGFQPQGNGGVSREAFGPAPLETNVALDPLFLEGLGISNRDACLPDALPVATERHVVIHPSFLKDYLSEEGIIPPLWRTAADGLRRAERIFVVGYSLPAADSAALTLLLTACNRGVARVINPDGRVKMRLGRLLRSGDMFEGTATFEEWAKLGCPDQIPWKPRGKSGRSVVIPDVA
jgi:hypothetical protein